MRICRDCIYFQKEQTEGVTILDRREINGYCTVNPPRVFGSMGPAGLGFVSADPNIPASRPGCRFFTDEQPEA